MEQIEIDTEVFATIKANAEPFVDTPNSVLRRLLGIEGGPAGGVTPAKKKAGRASPGSILAETEYELPILQELVARGGKGHAVEVTDAVGKRLADRITELDRAKLDSGDVRWRNRVQFTRLRLKEQGLLAPSKHRGVWEITDKGRAHVADVEAGP